MKISFGDRSWDQVALVVFIEVSRAVSPVRCVIIRALSPRVRVSFVIRLADNPLVENRNVSRDRCRVEGDPPVYRIRRVSLLPSS